LGLAPSVNGTNPNYVDTLYNDNRIKKRLVSWSVAATELVMGNNVTNITFGTPIAGAYSGNLTVLNSTKDSWSFDDVVLTINSTVVTNASQTYNAHLNTMSDSLMRVDDLTWTNIKQIVMNSNQDFNCTQIQGSEWCGTTTPCESVNATLPDITITFNSTELTIPAYGATMRHNSFDNNDWACTLAITNGMSDGNITLGTYFLASYYAELDYDSMQMSIGDNSKSSWSATIT